MNSRMFFAAAAVLSVIVLAALSAALPSALLPGNTAYAQTNSAPQFPSSETGTRTVDENTPWYQNIGDPVVATDPDDDKLTYSLENARTSPFAIDRFTGQLQTGAPLDYETQATYTAKVIAADRLEPDDPSRATDTITVTINVNNVDEPGKVSLTWTRLQVDAEVEASLTDPDGNVSGVTWHWEKSSSDRSNGTPISTATQATYTPVEGDVNRYLQAIASYTDLLGAEKTASSAAAFVKPVPDPNQTPEFRGYTSGGYNCLEDEDETADVCLSIRRHAPPGSEIHYPGYVYITDNDQVRYSIGGADAAKFRIGPLSGDLYTTDAHAYDNPGADRKFEITLTAADPSGLSGSIDVALSPSGSAGSPTVRGPEEIRYPENGTWPLATYSATASNPDRDIHGWIISVEPGGGGDFFDIDDDGVLTFTHPPDYEDPADENGDNTYSFTIMAYDTNPPSGRRPGRTSFSVRVTVADVNEPPEFSVETASRTIAENTEAGVAIGAPVTATDPDTGDTPAYTLGGTDAAFFDIDASTGQLLTQAALDYETKSSYTVTVTASDGTLTATVDVTVTVTNIDEAGTVTLSTNQPPARAEITAALTDPDEGVTGAVWQWERSSDGNTDWADIGTSSPSYTPVDGDVGYHLRATASYTDGQGPGKTAQAASTQAVQAGANRPPEFDSATATREVPENTEAGENIGDPVTANDPDTGDTPAYTLEGADLDSFDIDSASGQIQTKSGVTYDHESKSSYSVTVKADDNNGGTATIDVTITVADVDEPPEFDSATATREVPENTEAGVAIGAPVTANDPDTGDTPAYTLEGADADSFDIDSASGQIQTKSGVTYDHESKSSYSVTVKADDNNGGTAAIDVTITVTDVNEPPEFDSATATREVPENTEAGENIGDPVTANDPDNDTLTYTLGGSDVSSFDIDSASGQIQTKSGVTYDHESKSSYSVTVKADDNNGGTAAIDVTITVTDVNEPPEFDSATATREVPENTEAGENIGAPVTANDPDTGDTPAYTLGGTDAAFFDIDASTGQLLTQAALDYETKSSYTVTVTASDGTLTATVDVTVTVTNIDEAGTVTLSTNQPPARAEITAALTDPDEGVTGAVWQWERSSDGNTDWADIGTSSPSYTPVDGDVGYHLRATASYTDGQGPGKTAQAASTQAVQAGANRPPEFDSATATREVPENTEAGGNIGDPVTANDPDTGDTPAYTLEGADLDSFDIDSASGQIQTKSGVTYDHESKSSYSVTVKADDNNGGTATIDVTITVADVDEPPEFDSATATREVPENTEAGVAIGAPVTANDPDTGNTQTYALEGADADSFDIDSASGQIQTKSGVTYDHESKSSYSVTVKADDNNGGTAAIDVTITVTDVNEPPEFDSATATREVPENTEAGEAIGDPVTANDPDTGDTPAYTLEGADADSFDIDSASGQIQTKSGVTYDHESKSSYSVTVKADDNNGGTAAIDVTITVTDVNEPPEFDSATATREVPENTEAGEAIGDPVTANDPDNDTLTYTLGGSDVSSFDIDSASGQIQTKSGVTYDHESKSSYSVTVKADDNNGGTATIDVTITVTDVNEPPEFDSATATREVPENTEAGEAIGDPVTANDPDNDTLTYTLGGSDVSSFDIDSASGQIQTKSGVTYDHESKSSYSVTVKADDNNGGTAAIDVTITVTDVNEPPEFDSATATREVPENTEAGENIGAPVTANDPDTGDTPAYTLGGTDAAFFDIDASTGQLLTQAALDYETKSSYTVTVTASDGTLTATVDVTVTVTNIDEAGTVTLSTNQPPARAEITAALTDPDEGVTGAVWQWERSSDGNTDWADIGTSSPSYTPVDGDVGYHLRATASYTDGQGPGKTAQAASTQAVQAGANRPPEFDSATATREVPENTEAGGNIGDPVTANDPDTGDTLTYTLGGVDADSFDIGSSTGQITVGADTTLDYEVRASYTVSVTAADPSGSSAAIGVTIAVFDEDLGELGSRYDTDNDKMIDKDEAMEAIIYYLADRITRDELLGVITLYIAS